MRKERAMTATKSTKSKTPRTTRAPKATPPTTDEGTPPAVAAPTPPDDSADTDAVTAEPSEVTSGKARFSGSEVESTVVGNVVATEPQVFASDLDPRVQAIDNHPPAPTCPHCGKEL